MYVNCPFLSGINKTDKLKTLECCKDELERNWCHQDKEVSSPGWAQFLLWLHPGFVASSKTHRLAEPPFLYQQNAAVATL